MAPLPPRLIGPCGVSIQVNSEPDPIQTRSGNRCNSLAEISLGRYAFVGGPVIGQG